MKYKPVSQKTLKKILKPYILYFGYSKKQILNLNTQINKGRYNFLKFSKQK